MQVHSDIPKIECFVKTEFLFDMDPKYIGQFEKCTAYAISSYKDHCLTFKIILSNGGLFDYIPPHALVTEMVKIEPELSLNDLTCGKVCPDYPISINQFYSLLKDYPLPYCFFAKKNIWLRAEKYICTVDWHTENANTNIVVLENKQIAYVPNHKLLFAADKPNELPAYKKIRSIWNLK